MDEVLTAVLGVELVEPLVLSVRGDSGADRALADSYVVAGVDSAAAMGVLRYTTCMPDGSRSSWHTVGDSTSERSLPATDPAVLGLPAEASVGLGQWRAAVHAYRAGAGRRPAGVQWRPVPPGDEATCVLAESVLATLDELESGVALQSEAPSADLSGPDSNPAAVDSAVAAGHLRAAMHLMSGAQHRLRVISAEGAAQQGLWADVLARLTYAATQLRAVVPDLPHPAAARAAVEVADVGSVEGVQQQLRTTAAEITQAYRRLQAALTAPDVPAQSIIRSVVSVMSEATVPVDELLRALGDGQ